MAELKPEITYEDFTKLDLRLALIEEVEEIPGADKLYKLTVDVGELGKRIICAGIKQFYKPSDLIGQLVVIVANLAPRRMRGVDSHGMLLAVSNEDHSKVKCVSVEIWNTCLNEFNIGSKVG